MILMEIKIIKSGKEELVLEIGNLTIAELLRSYLNQDSAVRFAAWKREHPSKNPILAVRTQGKSAKKALQDAITKIGKDTARFLNEFKKAK